MTWKNVTIWEKLRNSENFEEKCFTFNTQDTGIKVLNVEDIFEDFGTEKTKEYYIKKDKIQ